jgi:Ohr subfamily peroxiredoxin
MKTIYSTTATVTGGRDGHGRSADGALDVTLAVPREMGGEGKPGTNPEQLFAVGYAACFQSAIRHVARRQNKAITDSSVTATVGLGPREAGGFQLAVDMEVRVAGISSEEAAELVRFVHAEICPYSNAVRGNVDVRIRVI